MSGTTSTRTDHPEWRFKAAMWLHPGESGWHFVTVPTSVADELRDLTSGRQRGFGSVRVTAAIGSTTWQTSVFPDSNSGSFLLPVKRNVRLAESIEDGDLIVVTLGLVDL